MAAEPGRASSWEPPPDWQEGPRVSGPYTFMRIPPGRHLKAGDVAIIGVPFDAGTTYRPGARFGPRALRTASAHLRPYPRQESGLFPPFDRLHILDYGDVDVIPYDLSETMTRIEQALTPLCEAGVFPLILGGDHSITLPVLRALAAKHGSLALVHFDAHPDYWEPPLGRLHYHGSTFRFAAREGLIDLNRSVQVGIRGTLSSAVVAQAEAAGFHVITGDAFAKLGVEETLGRIQARARGLAYVSLDIDCVDPAFAPGTGTPEVAGLTSREIVALVRGLGGLSLAGFDLVEVAPEYDPAEITAILGANLVYEFLCTLAHSRRDALYNQGAET